jgi:two-component system, cell cycle sensor histidine kinase and response regulator CckA
MASTPVSTDTVLVVDDDPGARQVMARLLEEGGFSTITAANGKEAIARLEAGDTGVRAVLTDVSMPDMTGVELAYWVRDHYPELAVAIVSGDISDLERSVVARSGVPFLKKPVRAEALHTAIREAIRQTENG